MTTFWKLLIRLLWQLFQFSLWMFWIGRKDGLVCTNTCSPILRISVQIPDLWSQLLEWDEGQRWNISRVSVQCAGRKQETGGDFYLTSTCVGRYACTHNPSDTPVHVYTHRDKETEKETHREIWGRLTVQLTKMSFSQWIFYYCFNLAIKFAIEDIWKTTFSFISRHTCYLFNFILGWCN